MSNSDKKENKMTILVIPVDQTKTEQKKSLIRSECILCPICGENSKIEIKDYRITIYGCKSNHKTENILLEKFENTQFIDEAKIICGFCKERNKYKSFNKQFCYCLSCKNNICLICKELHDKRHYIIDYNLKNYICLEHGDNYYSYCQTCNKNICIVCEDARMLIRVII